MNPYQRFMENKLLDYCMWDVVLTEKLEWRLDSVDIVFEEENIE